MEHEDKTGGASTKRSDLTKAAPGKCSSPFHTWQPYEGCEVQIENGINVSYGPVRGQSLVLQAYLFVIVCLLPYLGQLE